MLNKQQQYSQTKITNKVLLHRCSEDLSFKSIYHNDVEIQGSKLMKKHPQCLTEVSSRQIVRTFIYLFFYFLPLGTWAISQQSQDDEKVSQSLRFDVLLYSMCNLFMAITLKKRRKKAMMIVTFWNPKA